MKWKSKFKMVPYLIIASIILVSVVSISASKADGVAALGTFDLTQIYEAGDIVTYKGHSYKASHETQGVFHPGEKSVWALWESLPKPDYAVLPDAAQPFQQYATYQKDEEIKYYDKIYVATRDIEAEGISPNTINPWVIYNGEKSSADKHIEVVLLKIPTINDTWRPMRNWYKTHTLQYEKKIQ